MELSLFLAQLFGLTMIIFTIVALARPSLINAMMRDLQKSSLAVLMTSFVTVIGGLAVVLSHNVWEMSWVGLVTLVGWSALAKGVGFAVCPNSMVSMSSKVMGGSKMKVMLVVALLFGCYLAYKGFGY